jgi:uncharacterized protein YcnI
MVLVAFPAYAHVTVNPQQATRGGYAKLTFRVPTESDDASTTRLQVFFPRSAPVASALVKPHPGWSFRVVTRKLDRPAHTAQGDITQAVSQIVWRADSASSAIKPGEFDEFDISLGPLPNVSSMELKALQTYSDGDVVRWIQSSSPGAPDPDHPAPVLRLVPASATGDNAGDSGPAGADASGGGSQPASGAGSRSEWALGIAIAALVVALAGVGVGVRRRPAR